MLSRWGWDSIHLLYVHIASTVSEKETKKLVTFVDQVLFNARQSYVHVHAHRIVFTSDPDKCTDKDRTHNMRIKKRYIKSIVRYAAFLASREQASSFRFVILFFLFFSFFFLFLFIIILVYIHQQRSRQDFFIRWTPLSTRFIVGGSFSVNIHVKKTSFL